MENYEKLISEIYKDFADQNESDLDRYYNRDVKIHTPDSNIPEDKKGIDFFKEQLRTYKSAFPNGTFKVREIFVKGDKAIAFVTVNGRNTGELNGIAPTNREVTLDICEMYKFRDGKISDYWAIWDNLSMLTQLGLVSEKELLEHGVH